MNNTIQKRARFADLYNICPVRHTLTISGIAMIVFHLLARQNRVMTAWFSEALVRPIHRTLAKFNSIFPFSMAELLIGLLLFSLIAYTAIKLAMLKAAEHKSAELYRIFITPVCTLICIYALFCLMWGTEYYCGSFAEKSGLESAAVSVEELEAVTGYFAALANEYADKVTRDAEGLYQADRDTILEKSSELYKGLEQRFPCLKAPPVSAKRIYFSEIMSLLDFTGFFFPFTGEANVNMDCPVPLFAATAAHELAHQRGVAEEQECNFLAVLSSLEYGDPDYIYSASLLAYIHLGNALYSTDHDAWQRIYASLDRRVLLDFQADREYWKKYETPVSSVSEAVYQNFLYSYDQELGLKSYGACVDLLVNYYISKT